MSARNDRIASAIELDPERIAAERVALLTAPNVWPATYLPFQRVARHQPLPETWWVLSLARCDHRLHRRGPDTLELELVHGQMMTTPFETLYRADDNRLRVGDTIELTGLRVTVISVAERGPTRISFQFDRPLNDPSLRFIAWRDGHMGRVEIPAVGESVLLRWQNPRSSALRDRRSVLRTAAWR